MANTLNTYLQREAHRERSKDMSETKSEPFVYVSKIHTRKTGDDDTYIFARVNGPDYKWYWLKPLSRSFAGVLDEAIKRETREANKVLDKGE
jgi:hypothetical protein